MNSNFSKVVRTSISANANVPPNATMDSDQTQAESVLRDTDPDLPVIDLDLDLDFDRDVKSGVRQSWDEIRPSPLYGVRDDFGDAPVFTASLEPPSLSNDVLTPESLEKLSECLRGEISAVQTYDLALHNLEVTEIAGALRQLRDSHDRRVALIRDRLRAWGAVPRDSSGTWGTFARLIQRGADLFGDKAAISALEEGEDHGLKLYTEDLDDVDLDTREFIRHELLPDQRRTHDLCRSLHRFVKAA